MASIASASEEKPETEPESNASNTEIEGEIGDFIMEIDDCNLKLLKSVFLSTGRGRKKSLPTLTPHNKVFLQLHHLKTTYQKTWEDVKAWMVQLFPSYPASKSRGLIEQIVKAASLINKLSSEFKEFLQQEVDLHFIGVRCAAAGITRQSFDDPQAPHDRHVTRGILLELSTAFGHAELFSHVNLLYPNKYNQKQITDECKKSKQTYAKYNKNRSRSNEGTEYLDQEIMFETEQIEGARSSQAVDNLSAQSCKGCLQKETLIQKIETKNTKLRNEMKTQQEQLSCMSQKETIISNDSKEKSQRILTLESKVEKVERDLAEKVSRIEQLENKLRETKTALIVKKGEVRDLKNRALYKRVKRKEKYINSKLEDLERIESGKKKLGNQVRGLRRKISKQKCKVNKATSHKRDLKQKLLDVSQRSCELEAELLDHDSETLQLKEDKKGHPYKPPVEKCVMELCGENDISTTKVGNVIGVVSKWIFNKFDVESLPSATTANNMMDRAHVLSKLQVSEGIRESSGWTLHGDGTSRDGKKIVGQQVTLDSGQTLSGGFTSVAVEDSATLLDNVICMMEELSWVTDEENTEQKTKEILQKMFAVMSDRSSVNKSLNNKLSKFRESLLEEGSIELQYLYCNAHFLLGLSNMCENILKEVEKDLVEEKGSGLGRDAFAKFLRFNHGGESVGARYVRTACDVLGPRGDQKSGCKQQWDAFCQETLGIKSHVTSFRMNRFNNFFQGAAGLFTHRDHIKQFFTEYKDDLNLKLQSVLCDTESEEVIAIIRALGLIFFVVTGPFWNMLHSDTQYVDQYKYIQEMHQKFKDWAENSSDILESKTCIFPDLQVEKDDLWQELLGDIPGSNLTKQVIEKLMAGFVTVTERQLADFLPGGKFGGEPSEELRCRMKSCKLTNLVSEYEFGDLDFSQFRRRHASLHFHSSIQMVKRNKTISKWLSSKPTQEQDSLLKTCRKKSVALKRKHIEAEKVVRAKVEEKLKENNRKKKEKAALKQERTKSLVNDVKKHGGPCINPSDVDGLMLRNVSTSSKLEIVKNEIRYLKTVLGVVDKRLVFGKKSVEDLVLNLKAVLGVSEHLTRPDMPNPSSSSTDSCGEPKKKRKKRETSIKLRGEPPEMRNDPPFCYSNQGEWVAVAYESDWFIGSVLDVKSEKEAQIQFLTCGHGNIYRWPQVPDVDVVSKEYVFAHGFEMIMSQNFRSWVVPERDYIKQLYDKYRSVYFDLGFDDI